MPESGGTGRGRRGRRFGANGGAATAAEAGVETAIGVGQGGAPRGGGRGRCFGGGRGSQVRRSVGASGTAPGDEGNRGGGE